MEIVVLTNNSLKKELLRDVTSVGSDIVWIEDASQLQSIGKADVLIDLLYEPSHRSLYAHFPDALVMINSVENTLQESNAAFVRINGWNTFLQSSLIEAAFLEQRNKVKAEAVFSLFNKKLEWVADEVGFITPRVVSMIINEAFIALNEGVSTKQEMDTAMKLGTNYPYGPFEWGEKIGLQNVADLLQRLSKEQSRYTPSSLLFQQLSF